MYVGTTKNKRSNGKEEKKGYPFVGWALDREEE